MDQGDDPAVQASRERIASCDAELLRTLNERLSIVQALHAYKRERGYPAFDGAREDRVRAWLADANAGPLSDEAAREIWSVLIPVLTREAARLLDERDSS